jgi:YgiT-type zinc finger domain-containing protein
MSQTPVSGLLISKQKIANMDCLICKNGHTAPGHVVVTLERDGRIVLLKNVPAQVCNNCSSYFLDAKTAHLVLKKAETAMENGAELEVLHLQEAA